MCCPGGPRCCGSGAADDPLTRCVQMCCVWCSASVARQVRTLLPPALIQHDIVQRCGGCGWGEACGRAVCVTSEVVSAPGTSRKGLCDRRLLSSLSASLLLLMMAVATSTAVVVVGAAHAVLPVPRCVVSCPHRWWRVAQIPRTRRGGLCPMRSASAEMSSAAPCSRASGSAWSSSPALHLRRCEAIWARCGGAAPAPPARSAVFAG